MIHLILQSIAACDFSVLKFLYEIRSMPTTLVFIGITEFGSATTICGISAAAMLLLALRKQYSSAIGIFVTCATSSAFVFALKDLVHRARPDMFYQAYRGETTFSFPSGHAAFSLALYGFLALLVWRSHASKARKITAITSATLLIALIGFSRLYLGVHYLSDVLAGYAVGAISIWVGISSMRYIKTS